MTQLGHSFEVAKEGEDVRSKDVYRVRSANDVTLSSFEGTCNGDDNHQSGLYKTQ